MYLIYEFMHFCCHLDEAGLSSHSRSSTRLRRHHTAHHNARLMMEVNMNLTFPDRDWRFALPISTAPSLAICSTVIRPPPQGPLRARRRGRKRPPLMPAVGQLGKDRVSPCRPMSRRPCPPSVILGGARAGVLERLADPAGYSTSSCFSRVFFVRRHVDFSEAGGKKAEKR